LVRRRMQIDESITVAQYVCKDRVRDQSRDAAASLSRESSIKVASVGQVAIAGSNALGIDGWQYNQCAAQFLRIYLRERTPRHLDAV